MTQANNLDIAPDLLIRAYTWALLKANDGATWSENNYGGLVPIVPLQDEPELEDFPGPHIVYGYTIDTSRDLFVLKSGTMTFAIYDDNFRRLGKTINILETAFGRYDESARDVNAYTTFAMGGTVPTQPGNLLGIRFGTIRIGFVEGGTPETEEGGRQVGLVNIRYEYIPDYNVTTAILP